MAAGYGSVAVHEAVLSAVAPCGSARNYAAAMWASSACDPAHNLAHLAAAAHDQAKAQAQAQAGAASGVASSSSPPTGTHAAARGRPPVQEGTTGPVAAAGTHQHQHQQQQRQQRQWDAGAVREMEAQFLRDAEAQVAARLRGGVVRTDVTVLYAVASAA